jgi:nucleoside-diphosphate-sugar epimerase
MKIALTGVSGFIGNNLIKILLKKKNIEILNLYRKKKFIHKKVKNIKFDFHNLNSNFYKKLKNTDILIHLAWDNLDDHNSKKHIRTYKKNLIFLRKIISQKIKNIFIMGTCFEYGKKKEGLLKENYNTYPSNNYALSKDLLRKSLFKNTKKKTFTNIIWGRLFYLYGDKQPEKTLYGALKKSIKNNDKKFNMSPGNQKRDYLHIDDVSKYVYLLSVYSKKSDIFNICSGKGVRLVKIVKKWIKSKNSKIKLNLGYYDYSSKEPLHFWGSNNKLRNFIKSIN